MSHKLEPVGISFPSYSFLCIFCSVCEFLFLFFFLSILSTRKKNLYSLCGQRPASGEFFIWIFNLSSFFFFYFCCCKYFCVRWMNEIGMKIHNKNFKLRSFPVVRMPSKNEIKTSREDKILEALFLVLIYYCAIYKFLWHNKRYEIIEFLYRKFVRKTLYEWVEIRLCWVLIGVLAAWYKVASFKNPIFEFTVEAHEKILNLVWRHFNKFQSSVKAPEHFKSCAKAHVKFYSGVKSPER